MAIGASVGRDGVNELADVLVVQHLLNDWLKTHGEAILQADGDAGARTLAAIAAFQRRVLQSARPDGRIDPDGRTWDALSSWSPPPALRSGAAWWRAHQGKYPNSALPIWLRHSVQRWMRSSRRSRKRAHGPPYPRRGATPAARS
ncbi:peptidoglycan-binding domain-containing protein [Sphingomonas xinjiangensis]|uniref:Peptidoglycan hydrolase-like protein with peptidoglycan-binding domain n=1 Tax=Sphingomonas xinjiangensis TaxID=643568 RepID=A0A840YQ75_9SPHN|nr:peptidoglycan-binding domain-containing protein [Sphingomonas xinjiangensis]MBB5710163.1 peptidoglycan hydrolase-like protein with peptidoglycan-binding domain [Sphingomonas xinjiangensis]